MRFSLSQNNWVSLVLRYCTFFEGLSGINRVYDNSKLSVILLLNSKKKKNDQARQKKQSDK